MFESWPSDLLFESNGRLLAATEVTGEAIIMDDAEDGTVGDVQFWIERFCNWWSIFCSSSLYEGMDLEASFVGLCEKEPYLSINKRYLTMDGSCEGIRIIVDGWFKKYLE